MDIKISYKVGYLVAAIVVVGIIWLSIAVSGEDHSSAALNAFTGRIVNGTSTIADGMFALSFAIVFFALIKD